LVLGAILVMAPFAVRAAAFEHDLYFGMIRSPDVAHLQDFLRARGYLSYPLSTGNYLTVTLDAVRRFQKASGLLPVGGYFGPQSRAAANRILNESGLTLSAGTGNGTALPPQSGVGAGSATTSSYKGKIVIGYVSGWGTVPEYESMTVENRTAKDVIPITGFRIESSRGEIFTVPQGQELPGLSGGTDATIFLRPGDRATITVGKQERHLNFRENLCTGYFDETSNFIPSLSHSCPRADTKSLADLSDACLNIISYVSSCRTAPASFPSRVPDSPCNDYLNTHFNYVGCVADWRSRSDFYSHNWLIWMQRDREFFRNPVEHVILRDQQGKVVDEYSY